MGLGAARRHRRSVWAAGGTYQHIAATSIQTRIDAAEAELVRLKEAAKLVEPPTRAQDRARRTARRSSTGCAPPSAARSSLLETVSRSVPEGLWLTRDQAGRPGVQVDGRAMSLTGRDRLRRAHAELRPLQASGGDPHDHHRSRRRDARSSGSR